MLLRKLPQPDSAGPVDLGDDVVLASFKLKLETEGDLTLEAGGTGEVPGPECTGTGAGKTPKEKLSAVIDVINERFGTDFDAQDLVDGVTDQLMADEALVNRHEKHGDFINKVFQDEELGAFFRSWMLDQVHGRLSELGSMDVGR